MMYHTDRHADHIYRSKSNYMYLFMLVRYEKAALGSSSHPSRARRVSIQPGFGPLGDKMSERLDDLMSAVLWVKQELVSRPCITSGCLPKHY